MPNATDESINPDDEGPMAVDTGLARPARVENDLAGGDSNLAVAREAAEQIGAARPGGLKTAWPDGTKPAPPDRTTRRHLWWVGQRP